jgi:acyl-CoA synthetase (AMP-forming)/AMP-acid ligase II
MSKVASSSILPRVLDRGARWFARAEAVVDATRRMNFAQLHDEAMRAATLVSKLGAVAGEPVAVIAPTCADFFVSLFGVARMGGIVMAMHTRESSAVLASTFQRMGATLLVYHPDYQQHADAVLAACPPSIRAIRMGPAGGQKDPSGRVVGLHDELAACEHFTANVVINEDDPACIVTTSGTTSLPKGVVHSHRNLLEIARTAVCTYRGIGPEDRVMNLLSPAFIASYNTWLPFTNVGGCTVCLEKFDVDAIVALVRRERVSHLILTPTIWRMILAKDIPPNSFVTLKQIGSGAEIMDMTTLRSVCTRICKNCVQVYGSTESGQAIAFNWVDEAMGDRAISVGRPGLNGEFRIIKLDGTLDEELPAGEIGEIYVTSPATALEVWRNPELTAQAFYMHEGRRWWRSRDLGRIDEDGFLYIEGRHDDMIVSGGLNIMPGRVEEVILQHPGVREAAVVGVPHAEWGQQVQAAIIVKDTSLTAEALDAFVKASDLSSYMRPRVYHFVDDFPRTPTNKINRRVIRSQLTSKG